MSSCQRKTEASSAENLLVTCSLQIYYADMSDYVYFHQLFFGFDRRIMTSEMVC